MSTYNTTQEPVSEVIHGVTVVDPYRWLEERSSTATEQWIKEQQQIHAKYFSQLGEQEAIHSMVKQYLDIEAVDQIVQIKDKYFFRKRAKGQEQASIYVLDQKNGEEQRIVDVSQEGPFSSVAIHRVSQDGRLLAYSVKRGGERYQELRFVDLQNGTSFSDVLASGLPRGLGFAPEGQGVFYCQEQPDRSGHPHQIRFHRFGTCVLSEEIVFTAERTKNSRLLLMSDDCRLGALYLHDIAGTMQLDFSISHVKTPQLWRTVFAHHAISYTPFFWNSKTYVLDGINQKIVELHENGEEGSTIVGPLNSRIEAIRPSAHQIYVSVREGMAFSIQCWNQDGTYERTLPSFPEGTFSLLPSLSTESKTLFFTHESFTEPPSIYRYDEKTSSYRQWWSSQIQPKPFRVERSSYRAKDGTEIPIWLVMKNNTVRNRNSPMLLTAYGTAGISMTPRFSVLVSIMVEFGAIFALPNIRGGGEFGEIWHEAARSRNRQVAINDFLAAAEWLCQQELTSPHRLGIFGGSFSGLLVAAAMTQRPDLFRAVLCLAPILDMVRYEKFGDARKWIREFGSVQDGKDFEALLSYSPYHHVKEDQDYPSTLFVTGEKDGQCDPAHVRKMAARMQNRVSQANPVLVDYSTERGHSATLPLSVRIDALARRIVFLCHELGITIPQESTHAFAHSSELLLADAYRRHYALCWDSRNRGVPSPKKSAMERVEDTNR